MDIFAAKKLTFLENYFQKHKIILENNFTPIIQSRNLVLKSYTEKQDNNICHWIKMDMV